ncbi:hypothetical protein V6N13_128824 [Hibiscus sabdariffa]|uniref:Uncharacterized protein n=1 Tax=Hibiscus sabdariffa TaxID=183260 RepID=A0ABR2SKA7_9ROSI
MAGLVPPGATTVPADDASKTKKADEKVDYMNLPCPIPYEEIQREALMSLKPETFEGLRFDFTKGLNQKFSLSHRSRVRAVGMQHSRGQGRQTFGFPVMPRHGISLDVDMA